MIPVEVQVQTQHYLAATGLPYATAVGLVGGHQLIWKDIERNETFIEALLEREENFWLRVLSDNPPTATAPWRAAMVSPGSTSRSGNTTPTATSCAPR